MIFVVKRLYEKYQKKGKKLYICLVDMEKGFGWSSKKSDGVGHEKEGLIISNGLNSYELVQWCKDNSDGGICIIRGI